MKRLELKIFLSQAWRPVDRAEPGQTRVIAQVQSSIGFDESMELFGHKCRKDGTCVFFLFNGWVPPIKQILEEVTRKYFLQQPAEGQVVEVSNDQNIWSWRRLEKVLPQIHGGRTFKVARHWDNPCDEFKFCRPAMFWDGTTEPFTVETIDGENNTYYVTWEVA